MLLVNVKLELVYTFKKGVCTYFLVSYKYFGPAKQKILIYKNHCKIKYPA